MIRSVQIPISALLEIWPIVENWITIALKKGRGDHTPAFIAAHLGRGTMELFIAYDEELKRAYGCYILEFNESVLGYTCHIFLVAGVQFKIWRHLFDDIKAYARSKGCKRLESGGRKGWERMVARDGWVHLRTIIEMRLDDDAQQQQVKLDDQNRQRPVGPDAGHDPRLRCARGEVGLRGSGQQPSSRAS